MRANHDRLDGRRSGGQRGAILIWVALFLLVLIGLTSLGIDMAKVMATHTQLQNAADAAALAGASAIDPGTGKISPDTAIVRAQSIASYNEAFVDGMEPVLLDPSDVAVTDTTVTVTARREGSDAMVTYIAKVFGVTSLELHADATALIEPTNTVECGIVPLAALPPSSGGQFQPGCANLYYLKTASQGGTTGNYQALRFPSCSNGQGNCGGITGSSAFRCLLKYGMCCPMSIGDQLATETGNMSGSTRDGISYRFQQDTDQRTGICYSDYHGNGQRLVTVPITTPPSNGSSFVTVLGFAEFFLVDIPGSGSNSTIQGEFVNAAVPGSGRGTPSPAAAYNLRLIE